MLPNTCLVAVRLCLYCSLATAQVSLAAMPIRKRAKLRGKMPLVNMKGINMPCDYDKTVPCPGKGSPQCCKAPARGATTVATLPRPIFGVRNPCTDNPELECPGWGSPSCCQTGPGWQPSQPGAGGGGGTTPTNPDPPEKPDQPKKK
jgi:hypothetical protein